MATLPRSYTPMLMESLQWAFDPLGYADSRFRIMGDVFGTNLPPAPEGGTLVFLNHPDAVQFLLTQDGGDVFSAPGEVNSLGESFFGKNSVLMQDGQAHRRRRKLLMPPFHGERMKAYGDLICQIAQEIMAEWQTGQVFSARSQTQKMTMRVILKAVFGLYGGDRYRRLETLLAERLDVVSSPISSILVFFPQLAADYGPLSPGGYIKRLTDEINELLYAEISERRANPDPTRSDVLSLLLSAEDENGEGLSDAELRDELITLLVAGHETTATALAWALYWVHAQPEVKQTLLAELEAHRDADQVTLSRLPYLNAVCNETLRIYPVGILTLGRRVEKACQVMGYDLQKPYMELLLGFLGFDGVQTVLVAPTAPAPDHAKEAKDKAVADARAIARPL